MNDAQDAWPPRPDTPEPSPPTSDRAPEGTTGLYCFIANVILMITFAVVIRLGLKLGETAAGIIGIWLISELVLTYSGITLGAREMQTWQGKCAFFGSALMVAVSAIIVVIIVRWWSYNGWRY